MCIYKSLFYLLAVCVAIPAFSPLAAQRPEELSVKGLIFDLVHPQSKRRKEAAILLGQHKVRKAVPALIELTEDPEDSVRLEAVRALVRINDTRAVRAYTRLTHDLEKDIQEKAIEGIINIYVVEESGFVNGVKKFADFLNPLSDDYNPLVVEPYIPVSQGAIDALADLVSSPETGIRKNAAVALGILRAHSALPDIQKALTRETSDSVKVELIRAIFKIGDSSAGQAVIPFLRDPDKKVHDEAILTLGRLRIVEAVPQLKALYELGIEERKKILGFVPVTGKDDLQKKLLEALAYIGDPSCRDLFLNALQDPRGFYRGYGAEGLGRIGDAGYLTEVAKKYLREESSSVKLAMSYALYRLGRDEHLVELVDNADKDQVYYYLLELNSQEAEKLYPYLQSVEHPIKVRLLEVVGLRADTSAVPIIQEMMRSPNSEVASAANLALRRIQGRISG
ncbi:MAG: HEAT repeat domain-containing protein [Acidobacteriota bacterium]